jgi:adenylylsulfate reductase subunit A
MFLIVGGGMAACGTAFEVKKWLGDDQTVLLCDKAAMERSGAVAQGLSAINTYVSAKMLPKTMSAWSATT